MLFQLGTKEYSGLFAPDSWSHSGNEANLAQYDLIGTKPRLQNTGETLDELSLSMQLRAEYCTINEELETLETWKKNGEILPLLLGNGEYKNDYVIKSIGKTIVQTFADGTPIEVQITLSLLEAITPENAAEKTARKNAKAVGDKKQIAKIPKQPKTPEAEAHKVLMDAQIKAWEVANLAEKTKEAQNPLTFMDKVKKEVKNAQEKMDKAKGYINEAQQQINNATGIISSINQAKDNLTEIGSLMQPPLSLYNLNASILNLQSGLRGIDTNARVFTKDVILRKI